ncbi:MAG TPA: hypothetical protein VGM91_00085 [Conexibacter sp.]
MLFEAQRLPIEAALNVALLTFERLELGIVLLSFTGGGARELGGQEAKPIGSEDSLGEKVERRVEDLVFLDAEHLRVARRDRRRRAASAGVVAAVPVRRLLVAALHPVPGPPARRPSQRARATRSRHASASRSKYVRS